MGRNSKQRQRQQCGNGSQQQQHANELLNFHYSTPAASRQDASSSASNSRNHVGGNYGRNKRNHKNNHRRSARDRASVRQKADSSMFYLHSSAEHTFLLSRRSPSKMNPSEYSFHGCDQSVSWESVKMVHQRVPISNDDVVCPICLCDFVCARISKCGHSFCLPCILRHVQTYAASNPYHPVTCPCCGIPIVVEDMRPVSMEAVRPVALQQTLRLRKLHRQRVSPAPFLPIPGAPQHANPHFAPTVGVDPDAKYSRFNYLDPAVYNSFLVANQGELQVELKTALGSGLGDSSVEIMYLSLALELVLETQQKAHQESAEEKALMARFACSNSGMYQPQSPALVFQKETGINAAEERDSISTTKEIYNVNHNIDDNFDSKTDSSLVQRYRGDSVGSYQSVDTASTPCSNQHDGEGDTTKGTPQSPSGKNGRLRKSRKKVHGSMYLDTSTAVHLYQAEDGQLVFLNGFNMTCLLSDFSKGPPSDEPSPDGTEKRGHHGEHRETSRRMHAGPLPDFLEGRVLEKENVHLTSEIRKRMPFLNHIPLYTDIAFVELDLNHVLSEETRRKFKNDIVKRRKKRQSKIQAEKRVDLLLQKDDRDRINARKARLQTVDPDDQFFRAALVVSEPFPEPTPERIELGPVPGGESSTSSMSNGIAHEVAIAGQNLDESRPPSSSSFSFAQAAQRASVAEAFPTLASSEAFPTLGSRSSAAPTPRGGASSWGSAPLSAKMVAPAAVSSGMARGTPGGKKKKKKGQQVLLFSTGGARGY